MGAAVVGISGNGKGVRGESTNNDGVYGESGGATGKGVYGKSTDKSGGQNYGVYGESDSIDGYGVYGTNSGIGVFGKSTGRQGVRGESTSSSGTGVYGINNAGGVGVYGSSIAAGNIAKDFKVDWFDITTNKSGFRRIFIGKDKNIIAIHVLNLVSDGRFILMGSQVYNATKEFNQCEYDPSNGYFLLLLGKNLEENYRVMIDYQ